MCIGKELGREGTWQVGSLTEETAVVFKGFFLSFIWSKDTTSYALFPEMQVINAASVLAIQASSRSVNHLFITLGSVFVFECLSMLGLGFLFMFFFCLFVF